MVVVERQIVMWRQALCQTAKFRLCSYNKSQVAHPGIYLKREAGHGLTLGSWLTFLPPLRIFMLYKQVRPLFNALILACLCFLNSGSSQKPLGFSKSGVVHNIAYQCSSWWGEKCLSLWKICESNVFPLPLDGGVQDVRRELFSNSSVIDVMSILCG